MRSPRRVMAPSGNVGGGVVAVEAEAETQSPVERVLARLEAVTGTWPTKSGEGFASRCPAHDDRNPSLSIGEGRDGRVLLRCQAGCTAERVVEALGIEMADLFPARSMKPSRARVVAVYDYRDEASRVLFSVERLKPKAFRQRRPDGTGGKVYRLGDV